MHRLRTSVGRLRRVRAIAALVLVGAAVVAAACSPDRAPSGRPGRAAAVTMSVSG